MRFSLSMPNLSCNTSQVRFSSERNRAVLTNELLHNNHLMSSSQHHPRKKMKSGPSMFARTEIQKYFRVQTETIKTCRCFSTPESFRYLASCDLLLSPFAPRKNGKTLLSPSERRHLFSARCLRFPDTTLGGFDSKSRIPSIHNQFRFADNEFIVER